MAPKAAAAGAIHDIGWAKRILSNDSERHALCDKEFALADVDRSGGLDVDEVGNVVFKICKSMNLPLPEKDKMSELIRTVKHSDTAENGTLKKTEFRTAFKAVLRACLHEAEEEQRRRAREGLSPPRRIPREPSEKSNEPAPVVKGSGSESAASPLLWQLSLRVQSAEREIKECRQVLDKFALFEGKVHDLESRHQSLGSQVQALATAGNGQAEDASKPSACQEVDDMSHAIVKINIVDTKVNEFEKKLQQSEQKTGQFVDALQSLHKEMQSHTERLAGCDCEVLAVQQADRNRREQLDKHSQELASFAEHFKQLEAKLEGIETRAPQSDQNFVQMESIVQGLKTDADSSYRQLQDRLEAMEASSTKIPQSEQKLVQLDSVVDCLKKEIEAQSRQLETKLEDVQGLKTDMKSQSRQLEIKQENLEVKFETVEARLPQAEQNLSQLESVAENLKTNVEAHCRQMAVKLESVEVKLEGMEARVPQSEQQLPQLECAVEGLKSEIQTQRTRLASLDAQRSDERARSLGNEIHDQTLRQLEAKVEAQASRLDSLKEAAERPSNYGGLDDGWRQQFESQLRELQRVRHALEQRQASQERLFQLDGFVHEHQRQVLPVLQGVNMKLQSLVKQVDSLQVVTADSGRQSQQVQAAAEAVPQKPDVLFTELQALKECITAAEAAASSLLKAGVPAAAFHPTVEELQVVTRCIAAGEAAIQSLVPRLQEAASAVPGQDQALREVRALKERIAAGEAAMNSLAPRLRQMEAPRQPAAVADTGAAITAAVAAPVAAAAASAPAGGRCPAEAAATAKRLPPDGLSMPQVQEGARTGCFDGIMKLRGAA